MKSIAVFSYKDCELYRRICSFLPENGTDVCQTSCSEEKGYFYVTDAAGLVSEGKADGAIIISRTGLDASVIGNKFPHVRSSLVSTPTTAMYTREHNDSNLLCLGNEIIGITKALDIVSEWISHSFIGGRHAISVGMMAEGEQYSFNPDDRKEIVPAKHPVKHISIANDHAGYEAKLAVLELLKKHNITYTDHGTDSTEIVRYPYYAARVDRDVMTGKADRGILICGTGIGISIAANKYKGIRATLCNDKTMARIAREEFDSNILCLGGKIVGFFELTEIVEEWLAAANKNPDHDSDFFKTLSVVEAENMCYTNWMPPNNV